MKHFIETAVQQQGHLAHRWVSFAIGIAVLATVTGCQTGMYAPTSPTATNSPRPATSEVLTHTNAARPNVSAPTSPTATNSPRPTTSEVLPDTNAAKPNVSAPTNSVRASYILREGDTVKISFPGSPDLNTVQQIRTDGKITLPLVGEVDAAGLSTAELQEKLVKLYAPQLSTKAVIVVEVQSSSFPVYVTGAVLHPGKVSTDHPITALEAIMEAGGFDYTSANLKDVTVIRQEGNQTRRYKLNLKKTMNGGENKPFYLKPNDIIYVRQRFNWF